MLPPGRGVTQPTCSGARFGNGGHRLPGRAPGCRLQWSHTGPGLSVRRAAFRQDLIAGLRCDILGVTDRGVPAIAAAVSQSPFLRHFLPSLEEYPR